MTSEIEESPEVISSMRVTVRTARRIGVIMIISGIVITGLMLILNRGFDLVPVSTLLVTSGAGMITGISFAKAIQSKAENNDAA